MTGLETMKRRRPTPCSSSSAGRRSVIPSPIQIAAAPGPDDSPELHARDTIAAGDGLCDPAAVGVLVHEGPKYVVELLEWGAAFDRETDGAPALGREAAHSVRRVLHASDATGREIGRLLWSRVSANP